MADARLGSAADNPHLVRNYIMRANSFVVYILKTSDVDYNIINKSDIILDRKFLPEKIQKGRLRKQSNMVWPWQIPHGVQEEKVRDY